MKPAAPPAAATRCRSTTGTGRPRGRAVRRRAAALAMTWAALLVSLPAQPAGDATPALAAPGTAAGWFTPATVLTQPADDPAWRDLFKALTAERARQSTFEERRYFPFRKAPTLLRGEIRIEPARGLSIRYVEPEERVVIIDRQGVILRERDGRERTAPEDSRAQAATSALGSVLRFDLPALQRDFVIHGRRRGAAWELGFVSRDPAFAALLGTLTLEGEGPGLQRIELAKSATQRIEIRLRDTREDVLFTGDTLRRFFR